MPAKSPFKKRQIAGRSIFAARGVSIYSGGMSWASAPRCTRRRVAVSSDYRGRGFVLMGSALAVIVFLATLWMGWQVKSTRAALVERRGRLAALLETNRDLTLRLARLSGRDRVLKIAARRGLYPPGAKQVIRIR